ncbi:Transcriptional regulator [Frankia canadensis]|uniref:Transcriptional regulator n=1 Tax=Frankia canadensis TaxID=1836972 RepID=A0A2I2L1X6_9ACTN|nr:TetR/AcrR family transcriptional regulator [Frankia canadensis]SNQ51921.1 Transcriptional regulator [Frankia canadensis]SOU59211.1 Transcriptional regulator [Frankia canadensis]
MSPPDGSGRGRPRDESREQAILDAALELLVEVGYERMSMVAVASRARASKATIYRRWPCKDQMVVEALRRRAPEAHVPADTGSLREDLAAEVRLMAEVVSGPDGAMLVGVLRAASESPQLAAVIQANVLQHKTEMGSCLMQRAVERGELADIVDAAPLMEVILAMIFMRLLVTGEPLDDAFVEHVVDEVALPLLAGRSGRLAESSNT